MAFDTRKKLRAKEAAEYLRVSRSTLAKWRTNGAGPLFHHVGPRIVFYYLDEIDTWLLTCGGSAAGKAL